MVGVCFRAILVSVEPYVCEGVLAARIDCFFAPASFPLCSGILRGSRDQRSIHFLTQECQQGRLEYYMTRRLSHGIGNIYGSGCFRFFNLRDF